jgi:hypothetical protein
LFSLSSIRFSLIKTPTAQWRLVAPIAGDRVAWSIGTNFKCSSQSTHRFLAHSKERSEFADVAFFDPEYTFVQHVYYVLTSLAPRIKRSNALFEKLTRMIIS